MHCLNLRAFKMTNLKSPTTEQVLHILKGYRCSRQVYDDTGGGMQLVDALTPEGYSSITFGLSELENLADYIAGQIAELPDEPSAEYPAYEPCECGCHKTGLLCHECCGGPPVNR